MLEISAAMTIVAALAATFLRDTRQSVLALWVASLSVGGLYLSLESEFLAIAQWLVGTLVAITFIFYVVLFGEYGSSGNSRRSTSGEETGTSVRMSLSCLLGVAFSFMIWLGAKGLTVESNDLEGVVLIEKLGSAFVGRHILALEILTLTLFLVMIGAGVIVRSEDKPK